MQHVADRLRHNSGAEYAPVIEIHVELQPDFSTGVSLVFRPICRGYLRLATHGTSYESVCTKTNLCKEFGYFELIVVLVNLQNVSELNHR